MATFTRDVASITLAQAQEATGQQNLGNYDRASASWAQLLVNKTNELIDWLNGRVKAVQITNAEVFRSALAYDVVSAILLDASTEAGDRQYELGVLFSQKVLPLREAALASAILDTDGDGDGDRFAAPSRPRGWNAAPIESRIVGPLGASSAAVWTPTWD